MSLKSKIGLGTVQFGLDYGISNNKGKTSKEQVRKILEYSIDKGIDTIDTASAYGNAEEVLGEFDLSDYKVISKFMPSAAGETIYTQLQETLNRLNQKNLYGYLAHRPADVLQNTSQWEELQELQVKGLIKKIGFSLNEPSELDQIINHGMKPDLIQVPYNYFDRRFQSGMILMKEQGSEIHTRSAFLQGLFFLAPESLNSFFDELKPYLQKLQSSFENLSSCLLRFVTEQSFIDKVIIGVQDRNQLESNLEMLDHAAILPELTAIFSDNVLIPSRWPKN